MARRSLTLVALLCLIGASAFGAHLVLAGRPVPSPVAISQGQFAQAAAGGAGAERWSLRLYDRGGELCDVLTVAETESSRCTPVPGARGLFVASTLSPRRRYLFGVSGSVLTRIEVHAGPLHLTARTTALDAGLTHNAGLPGGVRFFVAILDRPADRPDPSARVHGLDSAGAPVGPARIDCPPTPDPRPCPRG